MRITAYLPPEASGLVADAHRRLACKALDDGLRLQPAPEVGWVRRAVFLPDALATQVLSASQSSGTSVGQLYGQLVAAALSASNEPHAVGTSVASAPTAFGRELRQEQQLLIARTLSDLSAGRIALCEAATGTGKGFAMAVIAERMIEETGRHPVIVASPTLAVLRQNWNEWRSIGSGRRAAIVVGRRQFVDPDAVRHLLDNGFDHPEVQRWWATGGGDLGNPGTRFLRECHPNIAWLADDLTHLASDFPVNDVLLEEDGAPSASQWYDKLRRDAQDAEIVFCSHVMLALDNQLRSRKSGSTSILPEAQIILIDEAHQFEQAVANAASRGLALSRLRALLAQTPEWASARLASKASEALGRCDALIAACREIQEDHIFAADPRADEHLRKRLAVEQAASQLLDRMRELSSKKLEQSTDADMVRRRFKVSAAVRVLEAMLSGRQRVQLTFAPIRRFPTITAGPLTVRHLLLRLWERTPAAALFSATLCLPSEGSAADDSYIRTVLALPRERTSSHDPIVPDWVTKDVTLMLPSASRAAELLPPARDLDEKEADAAGDKWAAAIASVLSACVLPSARGGTLVLVPSKDGVLRIGEALQKMMRSVAEERLVLHSESASVQQAKHQFEFLHGKGKQPVWIATGPAWTGLDLRDHLVADSAADTDRLLTDLVVSRVPFGVNRSATQVAREAWMGYRATLAEAMMLFKQGIGRLVRRKGLPDRRLWILDGRLVHPQHRNRMKTALGILKAYTEKQEF